MFHRAHRYYTLIVSIIPCGRTLKFLAGRIDTLFAEEPSRSRMILSFLWVLRKLHFKKLDDLF